MNIKINKKNFYIAIVLTLISLSITNPKVDEFKLFIANDLNIPAVFFSTNYLYSNTVIYGRKWNLIIFSIYEVKTNFPGNNGTFQYIGFLENFFYIKP